MAGIYKRGRIYWLSWYDSDGKRVSKSLKTSNYRIAKELLKRFEYEKMMGLVAARSRTELKDLLNEFVSFLEATKSTKSFLNDVNYLKQFFGDKFECLRIRKRRMSFRSYVPR